MRVNGILSFLSFCDVCSDDCRSNCWGAMMTRFDHRDRIATFFEKLKMQDARCKMQDASKPVARHFNFPNHSKKHMAICGLSLHLGTTESRKNLEQKFIFHP